MSHRECLIPGPLHSIAGGPLRRLSLAMSQWLDKSSPLRLLQRNACDDSTAERTCGEPLEWLQHLNSLASGRGAVQWAYGPLEPPWVVHGGGF